MVEYLDMYAKSMNFTYTIEYVNQEVGTYKNGGWSGSIGHLVNEVSSVCWNSSKVSVCRIKF